MHTKGLIIKLKPFTITAVLLGFRSLSQVDGGIYKSSSEWWAKIRVQQLIRPSSIFVWFSTQGVRRKVFVQ